MSFILLVAVIAAIAVFLVGIYNKLVMYRNNYKNGFAQIDVQLNRRYDLIPNLIEVAKKYMQHERETLEAVINARNQAKAALSSVKTMGTDNDSIKSLAAAESTLTSSMGSFFALSESYPDLKANQTMSQLMEELTSTENKVAFARQHFNDLVTIYNNQVEVFPSNFIANHFHFEKAELLQIDEVKRGDVKVKFD